VNDRSKRPQSKVVWKWFSGVQFTFLSEVVARCWTRDGPDPLWNFSNEPFNHVVFKAFYTKKRQTCCDHWQSL